MVRSAASHRDPEAGRPRQHQATYTAHVSETPLGTISSLEHEITHLDQRLTERTDDLTNVERKQTDLAKHLDQPFEYSTQLEAATTRQAEIVAALDITKSQAPRIVDASQEEPAEMMQKSAEVKGRIAYIPQRIS